MVVFPVNDTFAAEIGDIDLSLALSGENRTGIEQAFNQYSVLVFPDQHLTTDQHLDFARNFGPLETTIHATRSDAKLRVRAEIADVSNLSPDEQIWTRQAASACLKWATGCGTQTVRSGACPPRRRCCTRGAFRPLEARPNLPI